MASFLNNSEPGLATQLENWALKLPNYQLLFGLTAGQVTGADNDAKNFRWTLTAHMAYDTYLQDVTKWKSLLKKNPNNLVLGAFPTLPVLPAAPPAVPAGIIKRFTDLAKTIKLHGSYTPGIGEDLGILSPETDIDLNTVKPEVKILMVTGHPLIKWPKLGLDGLEIWKDPLGGNSFKFLDFDPHPDFIDQSALPAPGQSAVWSYRFIYRHGTGQVGQWSEVFSVTVMGL